MPPGAELAIDALHNNKSHNNYDTHNSTYNKPDSNAKTLSLKGALQVLSKRYG